MRLIPIGDKVVVQRVESAAATRGGILLPEASRESPSEGRVLSVGDGITLAGGGHAPFQVSEGDRVLFSAWAGMEVEVDGSSVLVMKESDILAILS